MLPRASQRATNVFELANEIAREYEQEYVGTEHVLLAIMKEGEGLGAKVMQKQGVSYKKLRAEVDKLVKKSMEETWVFGRLPGTPHYKNVMATAIEEAQQLESREVCTEHLLLALLKERGSVANKALKTLGLEHDPTQGVIAELRAHKSK